ncbi:MAG TPA: PKD domain-containing protein, partial [Gammaproteobacteria bacterium]|nr:PKD domain-containing protein [Gammaproteobacteria bacterium]
VPVRVNSADATSQPMTVNVSFYADHGRRDVKTPDPIQFQFVSNQDFMPAEFADDVELRFASLFDWTRMLTGSGAGWSVDSQFSAALGLPADNHYWYGPDNGAPSDVALVTPPISVGDEPFSVSFYHYYQFEAGGMDSDGNVFGYDGGVVEISTDGGATWQDVTQAGGTFAFGYSGILGPYQQFLKPGRPAFVNTGGTPFDRAPEKISFGTALAGKTVQLRFRIGSDPAAGEVGWIIDDVTVTGATAPMFSVISQEDAFCVNQSPVADAGPDQVAAAGDTMTLDGSGSSDADGVMTYHWRQTGGHPVRLTGADTATPTFTAPHSRGHLRFRLTVTDAGMKTDSDSIMVKMRQQHGHHRGRGHGRGHGNHDRGHHGGRD